MTRRPASRCETLFVFYFQYLVIDACSFPFLSGDRRAPGCCLVCTSSRRRDFRRRQCVPSWAHRHVSPEESPLCFWIKVALGRPDRCIVQVQSVHRTWIERFSHANRRDAGVWAAGSFSERAAITVMASPGRSNRLAAGERHPGRSTGTFYERSTPKKRPGIRKIAKIHAGRGPCGKPASPLRVAPRLFLSLSPSDSGHKSCTPPLKKEA